MTPTHVPEATPRRKAAHVLACRDGLGIPTVTSPPIEVAHQLTVGGKLVHRLTHRCASYCNQVAGLAGIGPVEAR